jgi:hypothetical protein
VDELSAGFDPFAFFSGQFFIIAAGCCNGYSDHASAYSGRQSCRASDGRGTTSQGAERNAFCASVKSGFFPRTRDCHPGDRDTAVGRPAG